MADKSDNPLSATTTDAGQTRSEAAAEFFAVGAPLQPLRASYVRRPADEIFFEALLAGRYAHVIAPHQSGKTSLVSATAARLENNGIQVAVLDLAQLGLRDGGADAGRFYYSVAYRILRQLRIRFELQPWWQDKALFSNRQRLHEFYSEVILRQTRKPVVILVDEVQCVEQLPFTDQLLTSIRSAHDARTSDPEFTRLTFALCGECDPSTLVEVAEASPFQVTQSIPLRDFVRDELDLYATELNLPAEAAKEALDRIYFWTSGQPYLTQKLARAVARDGLDDDIAGYVDEIVTQQFTGRAHLTNEPLLNHVHCRVTEDARAERLLNLYGRIRKGVEVPTDMGSGLQRRLVALGLLTITDNGELAVRNRIFGDVFTARWANENLPLRWRVPAIAALVFLAFLAVPFWYTQLLPGAYVDALTNEATDLDSAEVAWRNFRSFPGHTGTADNLYRHYLGAQATRAGTLEMIDAVALRATELPGTGDLPTALVAGFHDRAVLDAVRYEERDRALLSSLQSLVLPTPERRRRAARLIGSDMPSLVTTLVAPPSGERFYDSLEQIVSDIDGAAVRQWQLAGNDIREVEPWSITALEVSPLVRRIIVDQEGTVSRARLSLSISHGRHADLRIKLIAPSGKTIEIDTGRERSSIVDDIRIPAASLAELRGESLTGTWSLTFRDEALGVAGHLGGWSLTLNSQALVEDFQRGLDIPDPVEVEATNVWVSDDGRYAVARATQSDSARIWDLAFRRPVRAIAVNQGETLLGLDNGARHLVTATPESVNAWDVTTGDRTASLAIASAALAGELSADGRHLLMTYPGDAATTFELWSLESLEKLASLEVSGPPALVSLDADSRRLAVADFDRSVRIWNLDSGELAAQVNLPQQPSEIRLAAGGRSLGAVHGTSGLSLWSLSPSARPLFKLAGNGNWDLSFAPSGLVMAAGRPATGFQIYDAVTGARIGDALGLGAEPAAPLAFSGDESTLMTGAAGGALRFWRVTARSAPEAAGGNVDASWLNDPGAVVTSTADARKFLVGDRDGHLHVIPRAMDPVTLSKVAAEEVAFLGHSAPVSHIAVDTEGLWAATAATDGTVRAWSLADGLPRPWVSELVSNASDLSFSPDGRLIAALESAASGAVQFIDRTTGEVVYRFTHATSLLSFCFVGNDVLYVGGADGSLHRIQLAPGGNADVRQVWKGDVAVTSLARVPKSGQLIVVDADNLARVLSIADGETARLAVVLPSAVREVAVAPTGSRVLFRTDRWLHAAILGRDGLAWRDAALVPPAAAGRRISFELSKSSGRRYGTPALLVPTGTAFATVPVFDGEGEPGVFGTRKELVTGWSRRLGVPFEP